jgi:hypothetical protein
MVETMGCFVFASSRLAMLRQAQHDKREPVEA